MDSSTAKTYHTVRSDSLELELGVTDGEILSEQVVGGLAEVSEGDGDGGGHCVYTTRQTVKNKSVSSLAFSYTRK